jgi:hypothetical protein
MSLFDRLRPKWRHSDPAIRLRAVEQLDDQSILESIVAHEPDDKVRAAAIHALTDKTVIARVALSADSPTMRVAAVERLEDRALLLRIATSDPDATVRARARAKCLDTNSVASYVRGILSKLQVAECKVEQAAEFCGTLDEVCHALSQDPRFFINGDVASDEEDAGTARLRDATRTPWAAASPHSNRVVVRLVAQTRQATGDAPAVSGLTRFFHVKVWRRAENRFELLAEEKQFLSIHDAVAWSRASSGTPNTQPAPDRDISSG